MTEAGSGEHRIQDRLGFKGSVPKAEQGVAKVSKV